MNIFARRCRKSQRGAAQIEFALSILLVCILIFSIIEMMSIVYTYAVLSDAAKEGVRYAIVHGSNSSSPCGPTSNPPAVVNTVTDYAKLSLHDISAISVAVTYLPDTAGGTATNKPPNLVAVNVTYSYIPYIPLPWGSPTISTTAQGRIVY
jgi:Flp pilus assembly protein TadG